MGWPLQQSFQWMLRYWDELVPFTYLGHNLQWICEISLWRNRKVVLQAPKNGFFNVIDEKMAIVRALPYTEGILK